MKPFYTTIGIALVIVALSVGYYFVIFLPQEQAQQDLTKNQVSCLQLEQSIVKDNNTNDIAGESITGKNYYNPTLKKCFVETEDNIISNTTMSDDYSIYDAVEDNVLADCIITNYFNGNSKQTITCFDDSQRAKNDGNSPIIPKSQFDSLETQYMGTSYSGMRS